MSPVSSILIIQTAFIGDVILATALIEKCKRKYPQASIDFLLRKGNESLLQHHPYIRTVWIWDKKYRKYIHWWAMIWKVRRQKYDLILNLQRYASTGILTALSGASEKRGLQNPYSFFYHRTIPYTVDHHIHEIDRYQQLIDPSQEKYRPKLYPTQQDIVDIKPYQKKPYICIAPFSVWATKTLPVIQWIQLINFRAKDFTIYILGGKEDIIKAENILQQIKLSKKKIINLAGKLNLRASAALMQKAHMNYTNDSAPLHLASALNAPVTAIFCATTPRLGFGPLSDQKYIWEVSLPCKPCQYTKHHTCPLQHFRCAHHIDVIHLAQQQSLSTTSRHH